MPPPAQVAVLDERGDILLTNMAWADFDAADGAKPMDIGSSYLEACDETPGGQLAAAAAGIRAILSGERAEYSMEYSSQGLTRELWFDLQATPIVGPADARVVVCLHDVTERHHADALREIQRVLLDEIDLSVVTTDIERRITYWNGGAERLYGWTSGETLGRRAKLFASEESDDAEILALLLDNGRWEGRTTGRRKDGSTFPVGFRCTVVHDRDGRATALTGVSAEVSEQVAAERATLSARDYLRAVTDSIGEGLFTLDADGRVTYMNEAAELLLGWTGVELQGRLMHDVSHYRRADGTMVAEADCPICRGDGKTVRNDDDIFMRRDGSEIPVAYTASPFETEDGVEGCVVVFNDVSERKSHEEDLRVAADKLSWIGRVQTALTEDRFVLFAQPIVDLGTDEVVQHELLLRMREGAKIIAPAAFLKVAEEYGLIGDIDRWVIKQAVAIAATGQPIEVNISARSVGDQDILRYIERCINLERIDPALLVFEITETALVEDEIAARTFTRRLHDLGCKLALDDFGTGYGGFTQLKQLPVDFLKIDIEFVSDLATNAGSRHVVEAIVALARGFGMQTVAEGVEELEVLRQVRELGVDFAQGFHLGRPAPFGAAGPGTPNRKPTSQGVK